MEPWPPPPQHDAACRLAQAAARRGLGVIPLTRTKLPAIRSPHHGDRTSACRGECGRFGHGIYDASTDPETVDTLFEAAPWATGYAVACGRAPHHLIGIDLDVKDGLDGVGAFAALAAEHGFAVPDTVTVLTPSGGRHMWLAGPAEVTVPNSVGGLGHGLGPGIDVRGSGGYLVGPGSVTARGTYTLAPGSARLPAAPAPPALLRLLTPPAPAPHAPVRSSRYGDAAALVRFVLEAAPGGKDGTGRNSRLYWAACRAYEGGDGDQVAEALIGAAVRTGLSEREAAATVESAARRIRNGR